MEETTHARVHRFRSYVAVSIGNGETVYLSAATARELASELNKCVDDVNLRTFQESTYIPTKIGGNS